MLNHISNEKSAYLKLEAETYVTTARKNTLAFASHQNIPSFVNVKKRVKF